MRFVEFLMDLLLPATDGGVAIQLLIVVLIFAIALWRSWNSPEARLVVIGAGMVALGLMGFRALH